jgi:hypothetical protein
MRSGLDGDIAHEYVLYVIDALGTLAETTNVDSVGAADAALRIIRAHNPCSMWP